MNEIKQERGASREAKSVSRSQTGAPAKSRPQRQRSTPPYNPGLQKLVDGKQAWAIPLDAEARAKGFRGWHQRGYLPHYDAPGVTQFVTLRLVDSLPASRRGEWEHLLKIETGALVCGRHSPAAYSKSRSQTGAPHHGGSADVSSAFRAANPDGTKTTAGGDENAQSRPQAGAPARVAAGRERRRKLEEYLDRGLGECWLRQPTIAQLTEDALRFFDGQRYQLGAWVVMPNHVHLLVDVWDTPLSELIKSWKGFTAREANKLLGRSGEFWEREYLDTVIEDEEHRQTAVRYIENNPTKAKLVLDPKEWPWSSARFRDEYGVLKCSAERRLAAGLNREETREARNFKRE
ncbi:MAG: transposase [Verrucomicrobia bacterium]|nr:transposase [Verrucomicrobiota bacterium]